MCGDQGMEYTVCEQELMQPGRVPVGFCNHIVG